MRRLEMDDLNEGIKHNDLRGLIKNVVSIDQYKSKSGDDKNVCVLAIKINKFDPAKDLSQFIETGVLSAIDVDTSPGPDKDGYYTVFVEFSRDSKLFANIDVVLTDMKQADNALGTMVFTCYENKSPQEWNKESFDNSIITSSYDYVLKHDPDAVAISERIKFLNKY